MAINKRNVNYICVDVIEETISFRINDEALVLKIEENWNYLRLLFVFISFVTLSQSHKKMLRRPMILK